jgi:hypothetical protein
LIIINGGAAPDGADNIFSYDYENDFDMTSASQQAANNPINDPDPEYYSPKYVYAFLGKDTMPIGGYIEPDVKLLQVSIEQSMKDFV